MSWTAKQFAESDENMVQGLLIASGKGNHDGQHQTGFESGGFPLR